MDDEPKFLTESPEQGNIAAALVAEGEFTPHAHAAEPPEIPGKGADELLAGLLTEGRVKADEQRMGNTQRREGA